MQEFFLSLVPTNGQAVIMSVGGLAGAVVSFLFGDIGEGMQWLCLFVCLDYLTGSLAAWQAGEIDEMSPSDVIGQLPELEI